MKDIVICPFCGCGCGLYIKADKNVPIGVVPSMKHPINKGMLCVKGWRAHEFINHPDRLTTPILRYKGISRKVSWDEALDFVASKLYHIKEKYGQDSIGFLSSAKATNEENFLLMKFARAVIGTNNIDHCARL